MHARNRANGFDGGGDVFDPLSTSPRLWLDAKDSSTLISSSSRLTQWLDKSGNLRHATAAGVQRPFVSSKAGLPGVTLFDASTIMNLPNETLPIGNTSYTIMFAGNMNAFSNGAIIIGDNTNTAANTRLFYVIESAAARIGWWSNNIIGPPIALNTVEVIGTDYISGAQRHAYDSGNNIVATDTPGTRASTATSNTLFFATQGTPLDGFIHELFVWDYVLSSSVRAQIFTYLNTRWIPTLTFDNNILTGDSTIVTWDQN